MMDLFCAVSVAFGDYLASTSVDEMQHREKVMAEARFNTPFRSHATTFGRWKSR